MQGFKSFPEKTRLTFDKPITGIVGPNGSGKSNISDAILWAMGEQSTRTLRGGKMEDVIFGGTVRRTQVGFAEVTLILDNSDGQFRAEATEIMITRRFYRSGESEYYINKSPVRLKDLSEMLMDTGLGREGYSIIGQGRISEILSSKSKDRRDIFEEAAGISRYRHRKDESERKLQQTEENLIRIGDKVSELELQIEPLREQAEVAKKYLFLRDELRGIEIAVWLRELGSLQNRAEKAGADHITAKQAFENASIELEEGFKKSEALSEKVRDCDIEADSEREMMAKANTRLSDIESDAAVLRSQLESNAGQIGRLNLELQSQEDHQDGVGAQISERVGRLNDIDAEKKSLSDDIAAQNAQLLEITGSAGDAGEEIRSLLKNESENQNTLGDARSELSALASQAQELFDMENSVRQELAAALVSLSDLQADQVKFEEELNSSREETLSLGNVVGGLSLKLDNRVSKLESAGEKLDRVSAEKKSLDSRHSLLAEMEKDFQGYSKAVKLVMQESARGTLGNIHGTVGGLVKTGDRYAAAIETALGGALQHIIVDTEEDGKSAINLLKRRDGGRATFLPLSTIQGGRLDGHEFAGEPGFEGIALELVEYDNRYSGVYASLLGRVIIADNLTSAIRIAKQRAHKFKIVTLDGQVINVGGSMTGGSAASSAGVLSRANELEQLQVRLQALTADLSKAERELSECVREKNAAEYELGAAQAQLRTAEDKLIRQESDKQHIDALLAAASASISALEDELASINSRIGVNAGETESVKTRIITHEADAATIKAQVEEALRGQERLFLERDRVNAAISELRSSAASLDAERDALTKAVSELSALREEMLGSRARQLDTINSLKEQSAGILNEIAEKERMSAAAQNDIGNHTRSLSRLSESKLELEAQRSSLNKDIQNRNHEILDLERECSRLEQRKLAAQMEEKQIIDKLWDNYELSRSAAINAAAPIESLADAQRKITSIKGQLSELGNPNIGAIEEFGRVNTRYSFLTSQRDDVENARKEILGIIYEITEQMKEIFIREFRIINESFNKTFKELFGGGHATLELEDTNDVLGSGIEIHVQPPGKSLKTLTLLSGGEKAFVAIAIYFAILAVRPPPFVVMDEIEAALDDSNVLRFAAYLRRMSVNTQMIVISHKRATMEEADVLYGVTMQELGVSNILKIDLEEAEKHIEKKRTAG